MKKPRLALSLRQSQALHIGTFLATILVVLRHSLNLHHYYLGGNPWMPVTDVNIAIQFLFTEATNVSVPSFFFISGFLFFRNINAWQECVHKWYKRIHTLLIPYLLWNLLLILIVLVLYTIPNLREQLVATYKLSFSWKWFVDKLTLHPIIGHFWYIRTLIIFLLFTPVLFFSFQYKAIGMIILIVLAQQWRSIDTGVFSTEGALFFFCGSWMAFNGGLSKITPTNKMLWVYILLECCLFFQPLFTNILPLPCGFSLCISIYIGWQICLWMASIPKLSTILLYFSQYSFYLYALHGMIVSGLSLYLSRFLPHEPLYSFFAYVFCFCVTLCISLCLAKITKIINPQGYTLLSGGR